MLRIVLVMHLVMMLMLFSYEKIFGLVYTVLILIICFLSNRPWSSLSVLFGMFHSFSAYSNSLKIWNLKSPKDSLDFLNGMRVLSMFWVILGHTHAYASVSGMIGKFF